MSTHNVEALLRESRQLLKQLDRAGLAERLDSDLERGVRKLEDLEADVDDAFKRFHATKTSIQNLEGFRACAFELVDTLKEVVRAAEKAANGR